MKFRLNRSRPVSSGARLLVTGLAVWWVIGQVNVERLESIFLSVPWWVFSVPAIGLGLNTIIRAHRLRLVLNAMGAPIGLGEILGVLFRSAFAGLALPQGGAEVVKAALLSRTEAGLNRGLSAVVAAKVTQLPVVVSFLLMAVLSGALVDDPVLLAAALAYSLVGLVLLALVSGFVRSMPWVPLRFADRINEIRKALGALRDQQRVLIQCVLWALPALVINCAVVWVLIGQMDHSIAFTEVLSFVPAMDVVIWLPISLAGIGVRESVFAVALVPRGVFVDAAIAIGVIRWSGELARASIGCMLWLLEAVNRSGRGSDTIAGGIKND